MKNINRHIYLLYLLLGGFVIPAGAEEVPPSGGLRGAIGSVQISPIDLWEQSDSLYLRMDIRLVSKTMNDCQSWRIIPELESRDKDRSYRFPYVLINGKTKEKLYGRKVHFKDTFLLNNPPYIKETAGLFYGNTVTYEYSVPYESWMDSASLKICQILTSCAGSNQWFVLEGMGKVVTEEYLPYQVEPIVNYIEPVRTAKLRQMEGEAFLDFAAGRSEIAPSFGRNPSELQKIEESIREVLSDTDMEITGLLIEGYASPEGSYGLNERLSRERAGALKDYLQRRYRLLNHQLRTESVAEDWQGLRQLIEDSYLADKDQILSIIDSTESPDRKEERLRGLSSWRRLLRDYFPRLRRVKYKINYKVRDFSIEEAGVLLQKNPGHLSQSELFTLAESFGVDSSKWHEIMLLTVLLYPDDPVAHINMAASALRERNMELAAKHLEKVQEDSRAYNNLGVYNLLKGDTDRAAYYLGSANEAASVAHNLEELEKLKEDQRRQALRARRGMEENTQEND
ncbi:MAG: DUF3868 domain-containing protein [Tannerellaceae bacterium]|nr:DUF3868 domain-containing protein [Tannerellaceae bacterium]